jgi:hypothetical protein
MLILRVNGLTSEGGACSPRPFDIGSPGAHQSGKSMESTDTARVAAHGVSQGVETPKFRVMCGDSTSSGVAPSFAKIDGVEVGTDK